MKKEDIITDADIDAVWGNSDFGKIPKREVIDNTVLKCASGYSTGHTAACIAHELGLLNRHSWKLTKKGKEYLFYAFATTSV